MLKSQKSITKTDIEIKLVYFKMQEQGQYTNVDKAGFSIFDRVKC